MRSSSVALSSIQTRHALHISYQFIPGIAFGRRGCLGIHRDERISRRFCDAGNRGRCSPSRPILARDRNGIFSPEGLHIRRRTGAGELQFYRYNEVILYRLSWEGEVTLLEKLPENLIPARDVKVAYSPVARMLPGPIAPIRFYQYPSWIVPPEDVLNYRDGIFLGENWGELRFHDGKLSRWARNGAEILINPAGRSQRRLEFVLDSGRTPESRMLEAVDDAGHVVATATNKSDPGQNTTVSLFLPLNPEHINRFHLRLSTADGSSGRFEITPDQPCVQIRSMLDPRDSAAASATTISSFSRAAGTPRKECREDRLSLGQQ